MDKIGQVRLELDQVACHKFVANQVRLSLFVLPLLTMLYIMHICFAKHLMIRRYHSVPSQVIIVRITILVLTKVALRSVE